MHDVIYFNDQTQGCCYHLMHIVLDEDLICLLQTI